MMRYTQADLREITLGYIGGISNGDDILVKTHFKPTPSIFQPQDTVTTSNEATLCNLKGRHDPCIAIQR